MAKTPKRPPSASTGTPGRVSAPDSPDTQFDLETGNPTNAPQSQDSAKAAVPLSVLSARFPFAISTRQIVACLGTLACLLAASLLIQWRALNYLSGAPLSSDRGIFATTGWVINQGGLIYRDAFDQKPVGIHYLTAFALQWLDSEPIRAVWRLQWLNSILLTLGAGVSAWVLFRSAWLGVLAVWFVHLLMYHQSLYIGGHFAGEYGATVVTAAVILVGLLALALRTGQLLAESPWTRAAVATTGLLLSLATLFKEPFLLDSVALFAWICWLLVRDRSSARRTLILFGGAALIPYALLSLYFLFRGGLLDWLGVYAYNFAYTGEHARMNAEQGSKWARSIGKFWTLLVTPSVPLASLAALGLAAACWPRYIRWTHGAALAIPVWLLLSFLGASLGASLFSHYYMQCVVPYTLLILSGVAVLLFACQQFLPGRLSAAGPMTVVLLVVGLIYLEVPAITVTPGKSDSLIFHSLRRHQFHLVRRPAEPADQYILANSTEADTIWAQCYRSSGIYSEVRRRSATRYIFALEPLFINSLGSTRADKLKVLSDQLRQNRPKFLILEDRDLNTITFLRDADLIPWIQQDYQPTPHKRFGAILWQRK